ncbi:MAG: hypothetical protein HDS67_02360 [Bacteroidales bacterium]|nr:hypothetical protein [Bacteroidales bacterium]
MKETHMENRERGIMETGLMEGDYTTDLQLQFSHTMIDKLKEEPQKRAILTAQGIASMPIIEKMLTAVKPQGPYEYMNILVGVAMFDGDTDEMKKGTDGLFRVVSGTKRSLVYPFETIERISTEEELRDNVVHQLRDAVEERTLHTLLKCAGLANRFVDASVTLRIRLEYYIE